MHYNFHLFRQIEIWSPRRIWKQANQKQAHVRCFRQKPSNRRNLSTAGWSMAHRSTGVISPKSSQRRTISHIQFCVNLAESRLWVQLKHTRRENSAQKHQLLVIYNDVLNTERARECVCMCARAYVCVPKVGNIFAPPHTTLSTNNPSIISLTLFICSAIYLYSHVVYLEPVRYFLHTTIPSLPPPQSIT